MTSQLTGTTRQYDVDDIMKAVEEMPEDLCYHAQATNLGVEVTSACVYAHKTEKGIQPVCMVGWIVYKLDPELLSIVVENGENKQGLDETFLHDVFTADAFRLLQRWQSVQDRYQDEPWSQIVLDNPLGSIY